MSEDFAEKYGPWALIAGASEGTGAEFARQLAEAGLNLILIARREGPLDALAAEIADKHGVRCVTATIDLARKDAVTRMAEVAAGFEVGLLVFNAGADANGSTFLDQDVEVWADLTTRNTMTVMRACHHFGRLMRERGKGGILVCGSGVCYGGLPGISVYGATKAYDLVLLEGLWAELRPHNVDVLYLVMGRTDTPAHRKLLEERGMPIAGDMADAGAVARLGLERLPHGPIQNWGLADDDGGYAGASAAARRERILKIAAASDYAKRK